MIKTKFSCRDCPRQNPPAYMVKDEVWKAAGMTPQKNKRDEFLCFPCLEKRLGRKLQIDDFPRSILLNEPLHFGFSLQHE